MKLAWAAVVVVGLGCAPGARRAAPQAAREDSLATDPLAGLRRLETSTRARTDFAHVSPSDTALGTDPYVVEYVAPGLIGLLRGRSVLVELDPSLREVARLPAPRSPTGLAVTPGGEVFVVGELSSRIARYRRAPDGARLVPAGSVELPDVRAMRDIAAGPEGLLYVVEEHDGRLLTLRAREVGGVAPPLSRREIALCHGPLHVARVGRWVLVDCLLDHAVRVLNVDAEGAPTSDGEARIVHDGPMWSMDAVPQADGLLVAVGGVEDHPLDRTEGSFGFVDSFVTLYRVELGTATKIAEVNTSELGVVTPKALKLSRSRTGLDLVVTGYGSDRLAVLHWGGALDVEPSVTTRELPPGTAQMERLPDGSLVLANPLLDAWVRVTGQDPIDVVRVEDAASNARGADSRLGEGLFFTTLLAPWDKTEGRLSRFTCETCHFEGYVDGRTHRTGRGDVLATTRPLLGLFNDRPYFSRALDPDLTTMVDNEFRVAGAKSDRDPWFSLGPGEPAWRTRLGSADSLTPLDLRRALMTFFMELTHRPNPAVLGRGGWNATERAGASVFRARCESCHEARLVADDAATRVPFARWESTLFAADGAPSGTILWAHAEYARTGVTPYVSEGGARVPSLRRLYKKHPYFTNGSAPELGDVLDGARFAADGQFFHEGGPPDAAGLTTEEKSSLAAFLDLL